MLCCWVVGVDSWEQSSSLLKPVVVRCLMGVGAHSWQRPLIGGKSSIGSIFGESRMKAPLLQYGTDPVLNPNFPKEAKDKSALDWR